MKTARHAVLRFRNGKSLGNRVVVPPMASETADAGGFVTEKTVAHYARLARSGAGLVMVEYSYVDRSGRSEASQLGVATDAHIEGLERLAAVIHAAGAVAGIQLTHAGGKTSRDLTGGVLMAPSGVPVPVKERELGTPDPMSLEAITQWKNAFLRAAARCAKAGFDLVELHAAHGYGLNQWLSPITNRRSDDYGGSLARDSRLLFEIVRQLRREQPGLLLAARIPGQDFLEGGLSTSDAVWIAHELEKLEIDLIDVSSGIGGWRRPRDRAGEGYLVAEAALIQSAVSIPVIGVGGIESGSFIDRAVGSGQIALAAVGRAILGGPEAWGAANLMKPSGFNA